MIPRFSRSIFTLLSRRSQAPKRLAPPSPSDPQAQEPSHEEMQRYLYRRAKAEDAAIANMPWYRRMFRHPA